MLSPMLILERALESFIYLPCSCYLCDWRKGRYLGRADDEGNDLKFWNKRRLLESGIETQDSIGSFYGRRVVGGSGGKTVRHGGPKRPDWDERWTLRLDLLVK